MGKRKKIVRRKRTGYRKVTDGKVDAQIPGDAGATASLQAGELDLSGRKSTSTAYIADYTGPPLLLVDAETKGAEFWQWDDETALELGRNGARDRKWKWPVFERAFVEGLRRADGTMQQPKLVDLSRWSGASRQMVKNRSVRDSWNRKKRLFSERIPQLVEEATARHLADRIGDIEATFEEAKTRRTGREWVTELAEPYLESLLKRLNGHGPHNAPAPNVADAERLLRLMLRIEGVGVKRIQVVSIVNLNLQRFHSAIYAALEECVARGHIDDESFPMVLETIESHSRRVDWVYRPPERNLAGLLGVE